MLHAKGLDIKGQKTQLTVQEQMLVEQRVANDAKSMGVAYLLAVFFGGFGVHRFYFGKTGTGAIQLVLSIIGILTAVIGVGFILIAAVWIWVLVDLFLIPGIVTASKDATRWQISNDLALRSLPLA